MSLRRNETPKIGSHGTSQTPRVLYIHSETQQHSQTQCVRVFATRLFRGRGACPLPISKGELHTLLVLSGIETKRRVFGPPPSSDDSSRFVQHVLGLMVIQRLEDEISRLR